MGKLNLSYPDDETHASVQRGELPRFFYFFTNSVFVDPFLQFRPGRAQAGPGPKPGVSDWSGAENYGFLCFSDWSGAEHYGFVCFSDFSGAEKYGLLCF